MYTATAKTIQHGTKVQAERKTRLLLALVLGELVDVGLELVEVLTLRGDLLLELGEPMVKEVS